MEEVIDVEIIENEDGVGIQEFDGINKKIIDIFFGDLIIENDELGKLNLSEKKGIDKMFSQIFGTLHYGKLKILRDEVRGMLNLSIDNICGDEDFLKRILKNSKNSNGICDKISILLLNK